jgi:bacterioferritin-associated ferredoxin
MIHSKGYLTKGSLTLVICHCERVSHRKIAKAVRGGRSTVRTVCEETGAGRSCGGCVSSVKKVIEEHLGPCPAMEVPDEAA